MAASTWNFACHHAKDWPENPAGRGYTAGIFYANMSTVLIGNFTAIFSVLLRTGWTADNGSVQKIFSHGAQAKSVNEIDITGAGTGFEQIRITLRNIDTGTTAYELYLGDTGSYLEWDKWYQVAFSASPSGATWAVNGNTSFPYVLSTDNLAVLDVANATRVVLFGGNANVNVGSFIEQQNFGQQMPSCVVGPSAFSDQLLDLSDSATLGRIFDSSGDFRNPGEDGSLWFGGTYGANTPNYYFTNGSPRIQNGTDTASWYVGGGNNYTGRIGGPGGLRKQYE